MTEAIAAPSNMGDKRAPRFAGVCRQEAIYLLLIVAAGAAFRLYHIGWLSLWLDEAASEWMSRQSVSYLLTVLPTYETNPPLYYLLLKGWRTLMGDGEAGLRLLSALIGTTTIPLIFAIGKMLGGRSLGGKVGLLAAAMLAFSSLHVQYGQEARAYVLLVFAVALVMTCMMWLMLHTLQICARSDEPAFAQGGRSLPWVLGIMGFAMALIMWAHDTGALAVLAIVLPGLYWWLTDAKASRRAFIRLAIASIFAVTLFLPYLRYLLGHMAAVKSFWIQPPSWLTIVDTLTRVFGSASEAALLYYLIVVSLGVYGINLLWQRAPRAVVLLLLSVALVPMVLELLISVVAMPVFLDRTLLYCNLPLYLAAAYGIAQIPVKGFVAAVVLVNALVADLAFYFKDAKKEPWDQIAGYLSDSLQPGEPVILLPNYLLLPLDYYASRQKRGALQRIGVPEDWRDPVLLRRLDPTEASLNFSDRIDLDRISRLTRDSRKLAIVMRRVDLIDPKLLVKQEVLKTHVLSDSKTFFTVTVLLFESRAGRDGATNP